MSPFDWQWRCFAWSRRNRAGTIIYPGETWHHVAFGLWVRRASPGGDREGTR